MLSGKKIILGVSAGIAAYKAVELVRLLQKAGAEVRVCTTPDTKQFVGNLTFEAITKHKVASKVFNESDSGADWTQHISWGEWADLFIVAPCTANTLAKIASGISDNMLTTTVLTARCPILICPTMDGEMYLSPAVTNNIKVVESYGYHILPPEDGYLASGLEGKGRLPSYDAIIQRVNEILNTETETTEPILKGKKVLVTAGPTREFLDPVRFLSNPSSGKMGISMAESALLYGAEVHLLVAESVNTSSLPEELYISTFVSADELFEAMQRKSEHFDIIIMAAAVADWKASIIHSEKLKKTDGNPFEFTRTVDILSWLGENRKPSQTIIGFAMETERLLENAKDKLERKKVDWVIGNLLEQSTGSVFGADKNEVLAISSTDSIALSGSKKEIASQFLAHALQ